MKNRALKLLSYLLTLCMLVTSVPMMTFAAPAAVTVADTVSEKTETQEDAVLATEAPQIKNIIFLIPDGAGYGSLDFANDVKMAGGFDESKYPYKTETNTDPMTLFSYHAGSMVTLNIYNSMTDSAAAGTAMSTGYRTINNYVGLDRRKMPRANLTEAAQSVGMATGIVSTYEWPHATPASFTAHSIQRSDYADFFRQIENKNLQVVLGNGYGSVAEYGATLQNAVDNGYTIVSTKEEMAAVQPGDKIWGNAYETSFDFDVYNKATTPTLAEMTSAAITALSGDEDGFFLMVEGSKVDTGGHANDTLQMSSDYIAFDAAFKVAVDFAKSRTDTVVIAAPDHDTGGLYYDALVASGNLETAVAETQAGSNSSLVTWESGSHTLQDVPFWCYYPEGITGIEGAATPGTDYYVDENGNKNPVRTENVIDNTSIAPWAASLIGVDLDALTEELFVDVTDIGIYDEETRKFTFNNGNKYAYKDQAVYYRDDVKTEMFGQMIVVEGTVYLPSEIIDEEDWNYVTEDYDGIVGTGTQADPYVIDDAWDFLEFTNNMINDQNYSGKYIVQGADIDMSNKTQYNGVLSDVSFAGHYDGQGYTINVNIDTTSGSENAVLFGVNDGTIVNLGVMGTVKSASGYAAFVRKNNSAGKIVNCFSNLTVSSTGSSGNGFAISNYGTIENVYFGGTASHHPITGSGTLTNCYYVEGSTSSTSTAGTVVTADVAKTTLATTLADGLSSAATTLGTTTDNLNTWYYISGIDYPVLKVKTPEVTGITLTPSTATVKRGESVTLTPTVLGNYNPSQAVVWEINPAPSSEETKLYEDGFFKVGADETTESFTIIAKSAVAGNYAISSVVTVDLSSDAVVKEDGTRTHPYLIENEDDFFELTTILNGGTNCYLKYYKQTADLDMEGYEGYYGVEGAKYFAGFYDGNGYTINVNIETTDYEDVCLFGSLQNGRVINLGLTGSIKGKGYIAGFTRNMSYSSTIINCWTNAHIESIAKGTSGGNDASGFARSPYSHSILNCYFAGELISPGGTSQPIASQSDGYDAVYYNNYFLGNVFYVDEEMTEFSETELNNGELVSLLNSDFETVISVANTNDRRAENPTTYTYSESMLMPWILDIGGPRHRIRDDSVRIDKTFDADKAFSSLVIGTDATADANGNIITVGSLTVKADTTLHLEQGTYIFDEADVSGTITASPNANVIINGTNKPAGYVELDIGAPTGTRYAEVCGYQYEIVENDNRYGVITSTDLLVEVVDIVGESDEEGRENSVAKYYHVDASEGTCTLLSTMTDYMKKYDKYSIRLPDESKNSKTALRFKACILNETKLEETEYVVDEYGYIITLEEKLNNNNCAQLNFDFTVGSGLAYVSGVGYNKELGTDKKYESDDDQTWFTAAFYNIPVSAYGKRLVSKTYTKLTIDGVQFTIYGEPMVTSLYSVAESLIETGTVTEGTEQYDVINGIIEDAVDDGFGNEAGGDTGDLWG